MSKGLAMDCNGIVNRKYMDAYPESSIVTERYELYIKGHGLISWYKEDQLELIETDRFDLLGLGLHDLGIYENA